MDREEFIKLVAELMEGTQVPRSIPGALGAGRESWDKLKSGLGLFGWSTAEEYEAKIRQIFDC